MEIKWLVIGVSCILLSVGVYSQQADQPPQTTSISALIDAIGKMQAAVENLQRDSAELRTQLQAKLDRQYQSILLYNTVFLILLIASSRLLGRFYNWFMWRRWGKQAKREMTILQEAVSAVKNEVDNMSNKLISIDGILGGIHTSVAGVPAEIQVLRQDVEQVKAVQSKAVQEPKTERKKKGFWLFNMFRRKPSDKSAPVMETPPLPQQPTPNPTNLAWNTANPNPPPEQEPDDPLLDSIMQDIVLFPPAKAQSISPRAKQEETVEPKPTPRAGRPKSKVAIKQTISPTKTASNAEVWEKGGRYYIREVLDSKTRVHAIKKEDYFKLLATTK
jgi:regulator of replication initiation timing